MSDSIHDYHYVVGKRKPGVDEPMISSKMKLIDCNETLRKVEQIPFITNENKAFHEGCRYMQKKVLRIFHESKFVDAEPVRHGHWVTHNPNNPFEIYGECSECGLEQSLSESLPYCPNCGAKMDEVSE